MALLMTSALSMQVLAGVSHLFHLCYCSLRNFFGVMTRHVLSWQLPLSPMKKHVSAEDLLLWLSELEKKQSLQLIFFFLTGYKILKDSKGLKVIFRYLSTAKSCWTKESINETTLHRNAEFMLSWIIYISKNETEFLNVLHMDLICSSLSACTSVARL